MMKPLLPNFSAATSVPQTSDDLPYAIVPGVQ